MDLTCPRCEEECEDEEDVERYDDERDLIEHYMQVHEEKKSEIRCPVCEEAKFVEDGEALINHLERFHSVVIPRKGNSGAQSKLPKVGDKVIALWGQSKWQYFTAKIRRFHSDQMKYEIDWDDGDTTGRIVDVENLAFDRIPDEDEIGVGSIVLFPQGGYKAGQTQETGGKRWHQGIITSITKNANGEKRYNGHHTKTEADGKWVTYKDYEHEFSSKRREEFRVAPNVFDVLHFDAESQNNEEDEEDEDVDIYISYDLYDSPEAYNNNAISQTSIPESYEKFGYDNMCDPKRIEDFLRQEGFKVIMQQSGKQDLKTVASKIKKAKVFIGCLSDQYVANSQTKMEFQYAKTTLGKPTIPCVVGEGSFNWMSSMIGMLIAGELFIHYRGPEIEHDKNSELLMNLRKHIPISSPLAELTNRVSSPDDGSPPDVFLSYCWTNSTLAREAKQIKQENGTPLSDPRFLKKKLSEQGYKVWLDVERLNSANPDAGLFGQIVEGLKNSKVVVPCISDEYAKSANCRMEFQFALKSIFKPAVPLIVGHGDEWRSTVIGALLATHEQTPIDLQGVNDNDVLDGKLEKLFDNIDKVLGKTRKSKRNSESESDSESEEEAPESETLTISSPTVRTRAPKVGDHVVSHHFNFAYYMATIAEYNEETMEYTVDWDDGDPTGRVQSFDQVALDVEPEADDIGVGTIIFFPQGTYRGTEGNNTGGVFYHEGEVTHVNRSDPDNVTVSGHHTKTKEDGKREAGSYRYEFWDLPLSDIRLAPTALEAMLF